MINNLQTRTFHTLDGLRGIAALAVVCAHFSFGMLGFNTPSAYLAVDLFFLMSGVVLTHVYEHKLLAGMTVRTFLAIRVARLYPMYFAGLVVAASAMLMAKAAGQEDGAGWDWWNVISHIALNLLMLPAPPVPHHAPALFTLNFVSWSLFWEMMINIVFAMTIRWLSNRLLAKVAAVAAFGLIAAGLLQRSLDIGVEWPVFWGGPLRVTFSFALGILLYRLHQKKLFANRRVPAPWLILTTLVLLLARPGPQTRAAFDLACVIIAFPLVVALALENEPTIARKIYSVMGVISYPVYVIHVGIYYFYYFFLNFLHAGGSNKKGFSILILTVALSWVLAQTYDLRARAWLSRFLRPPQSRSS